MACWRRITAPVLWVEADDTNMWQWMGPKEEARIEIDRRLACIKDVRCEMMADAGHMLHHDQPAELARLVETFLGAIMRWRNCVANATSLSGKQRTMKTSSMLSPCRVLFSHA